MRFSEITRDAVAYPYADQKTSIKSKNGIEDANLNELATIIVAFAGPGMVGQLQLTI